MYYKFKRKTLSVHTEKQYEQCTLASQIKHAWKFIPRLVVLNMLDNGVSVLPAFGDMVQHVVTILHYM